jgi:hypothetical protein
LERALSSAVLIAGGALWHERSAIGRWLLFGLLLVPLAALERCGSLRRRSWASLRA